MSASKKSEFFEGLRDAMTEGLEALRADKVLTTREVTMLAPPKPMTPRQIKHLRTTLHFSQTVFARIANSSVKTVHAWEQGRTKPSGCALRFLRLLESRPELVGDFLDRSNAASSIHIPARRKLSAKPPARAAKVAR